MASRRRLLRGAAGVVAVAVVAGLVAWTITPSTDDAQVRVEALAAERNTIVVQAAEVPKGLADALVAIEDERFWVHHGIDVIGLSRAVLYDASQRCLCQGGSTITQQVVKILYLGGYDRDTSKLADFLLAFKLERHVSKRQILADYLTIAPFGANLYGAHLAACTYFRRPLAVIDLAQAALLAGLPQGPSAYDPLRHPAAALDRRAAVLERMRADGYITRAQERTANAAPLLANGAGC